MGIVLVEGESVNQGGSGGGGGGVTSQDLADAIAAREAAQATVDAAQDALAIAEEADDDTVNAAQDNLITANQNLIAANEALELQREAARESQQVAQNARLDAIEELLGSPAEDFDITPKGQDSGTVVLVWSNSGANQQRILSDNFYVSDDPDSFVPLTTVNIPNNTTKRLYIVGLQYINGGSTAGTAAIGASVDFTNTDGNLTASVISANSETADYTTTTFNELTNINNLNPSISQAHINYVFAAEQGTGFVDLGLLHDPATQDAAIELGLRTSRDKLAKQGNNLIWNGFGHSGVENIFSSNGSNLLTHEPDDCSFKISGSASSSIFFEDKIKIDNTVPLRHKGLTKGDDGRMYAGIRFFDANDEIVDYHNHTFIAASPTVLTQPFSPGDTVMHVADASGWVDTGTSTTRGGLAFIPVGGYKEGKAVETETGMTQFSYNVYTASGAGGGYTKDEALNTINFASPVTRADYFKDNQPWPVGTIVRQPSTRGPYRYTFVNFILTPEYTLWDTTMIASVESGVTSLMIPPGAEFAQPMFLCLRNLANAPGEQWFKNISITQGL